MEDRKRARMTPRDSSKYLSELTASPEPKPKLAIIVPFRDTDPKQHRQAHLDEFLPSMIAFLKQSQLLEFKIFVVEQSNDGRKFNRGKLLNYGYTLAKNEGFDLLVFHDVDLVPKSTDLAPWYCLAPRPNVVHHIAKCWSRYSKSPTYLGGALAIRLEDFEHTGGFPNIYWGWGGEDDEFAKRVKQSNLRVEAPAADSSTDGWLLDLEGMNLTEKLDWLRQNREVKCGVKWEVNDAHEAKRVGQLPRWWGIAKGLEGCKELSREVCGGGGEGDKVYAERVKVDLGSNLEDDGAVHWADKHDEAAGEKAA